MLYKDKSCTDCGKSFTPASGRQSRCTGHGKTVASKATSVVPDEMWIDKGRPHVANRTRRTELALKLARTASRAGYHRLAANYVQYAECVGRGYVEPNLDRVRIIFGHGFGPVPADSRFLDG